MGTKDEKPMEKMQREMQEKTPTEAVRDDLFGGSPEPSEEQESALQEKVEEQRSKQE